MDGTTAELTSLATALEELSTRVTSIAEGLSGTERDATAVELYEVERARGDAQRRLARGIEPG